MTSPALEQHLADMKRWEGVYAHLYLDDRGYPTAGIGNLVASPSVMLTLPWKVQDSGQASYRDASDGEKAAAWDIVDKMPRGMRAGAYAGSTRLRLMSDDIDNLCRGRIANEFLPRMPHLFVSWATYPFTAQRALLDMAYTLGMAGLSKYQRMRSACERWDWAQAAKESVRVGGRRERNDWVAELLTSCAGSVRPTPAA